MTIINRALHKAYQRRAASELATEPKRTGSASVSGWAANLRDPVRPPARPAPGPAAPELPAPEITPAHSEVAEFVRNPRDVAVDRNSGESRFPKSDTDQTTSSAVLPAGTTIHRDMGHGTAPASAPALLTTIPVQGAPAATPPRSEQWSWPPIVQRLLSCPAAPELLDLAVQLRGLAAGEHRCIAFSGPGRNAGRTSLVLTLASVLIADKVTRVAIVDADFDHPDAAQLISLHPTAGLEQAINNPGADHGAVTTLIAGRLAVVPLVKPVAAEAIDQRRIGTLQTFLRSLRREYDIVLLDAGPWEPEHPPLLLECRAVDALVCVCRASDARATPVDEGNFQQPGVEWLGVVETFSPIQLNR